MIRFKRNVDTSHGFMKIGAIKSFTEFIEKNYIQRGIADPYEMPGQKEEKTEIQTKELKVEVKTKRGRKPKNNVNPT